MKSCLLVGDVVSPEFGAEEHRVWAVWLTPGLFKLVRAMRARLRKGDFEITRWNSSAFVYPAFPLIGSDALYLPCLVYRPEHDACGWLSRDGFMARLRHSRENREQAPEGAVRAECMLLHVSARYFRWTWYVKHSDPPLECSTGEITDVQLMLGRRNCV